MVGVGGNIGSGIRMKLIRVPFSAILFSYAIRSSLVRYYPIFYFIDDSINRGKALSFLRQLGPNSITVFALVTLRCEFGTGILEDSLFTLFKSSRLNVSLVYGYGCHSRP